MEGKSSNENICVVCFRNINIYAVGICDHYDRVCFICSARLRVLCQKFDCPICRKNLPKVIFTHQKQPFSVLSRQPYSHIDHKHNICFENEDVEEEYRILLQHQCLICVQVMVFQSFGHLKDHMRKIHEKFYCELCVDHLKLFTFERKYYNRKELAKHRRAGDSDDTSHRGHPRCQFCDTRFIDKDELFRHLRKEHFYCHFCDADGSYDFYGDYEFLRKHFQEEHFLCQEDSCKDEKFTSAFRSDIELKAHIAAQHSKNYTKQQAKQARTLELEFTITPRSQYDEYEDGGRRGGRKGPRGTIGRSNRYHHQDEDLTNQTRESTIIEPEVSFDIDRNSSIDFPSLGNNSNDINRQPVQRPPPRNYREFNAMDAEYFPPLGGTGAVGSAVRLEIYNQDKKMPKKGPNVSIKVSSRGNPNSVSAAAIVASAASVPQPKQRKPDMNTGWFVEGFNPGSNDFPTLETKPIKKSTLSWTPNVSSEAIANAWVKDNGNANVNETKKESKVNEEEFIVVLSSKDKKKKLKNSNNQVTKAQSSEKEIANPHIKKEASAPKEIKTIQIPVNKEITSVEEKIEVNGKANGILSHANQTGLTKVKNTTLIAFDDFPPLLGMELPTKPTVIPPGFNIKKNQVKEPPPGFNKTNPKSTANDKGLKTTNFTLSSLARQLAVSTNISDGSSPEISPSSHPPTVYVEPEDFQNRNRNLIQEVMELLEHDDAKFEEFKSYSGKFRKGVISASDYYHECVRIFGKIKFEKVLSELLVLLPDIVKQRELLKVHNEKSNLGGVVPKNRQNFLVCATCQQVLNSFDFRTHMLFHNIPTSVA